MKRAEDKGTSVAVSCASSYVMSAVRKKKLQWEMYRIRPLDFGLKW